MKIAVRRRLAVGALGTATAVVGGFLALPSAQAAGNTLTVNPAFAYNNEASKTITVTPTSSGNPGYPPGSTVTFTRVGTTDTFSKQIDPSDPTAPTVTVDFTDVGSGVGGDGPANPGTYDVTIAAPVGGAQYSDSCSGCFQVLTPNASPSVTQVTPGGLAQGGSGNVTVTGTGFSRGSVLAVLLPDGSPDTAITTSAAPKDSSGKDVTNGITTNTTIQRYWTVGGSTPTGPRDVRVTNTDGTFAVCAKCFTVNGGPLSGVSPVAGSNNPNAGVTRVTFTGTNLTSGEPRLVYAGDAGSSTKTDLTLVGTNASYNGTSVSADFDLRSAAPGNGAYQPTLVQPDGSQNTCACRFSVGQAAPAAVTSLDKTSQAAGTTQTVKVTGSNFSKGVRITISGTGVTTTSVAFVSPTEVDATFSVDSAAQNGARDVTPVTTDGVTGTACKGCYTITGGSSGSGTPSASASASSTSSGSPCPSPASASPSASPSASASSGGGLPLPGGSPSASASGSASPSASASASATPSATASASSTASPTATASPTGILPISGLALAAAASGTPSASAGACPQLTISVNPADIVPNEPSTVTVTGQPNTPVELYAYSRPSTAYGKVRSGVLNANGTISWNVTPGGNTRLYAHYARTGTTTASDDSKSVVIIVHTSLSLSAYRDGVRKYHFQGTNLPRRPGQLITLYRYATGPNLDQYCVPTAESDTTAKSDGSCKAIITSQAKTGSNNTWRIDRTFSGSGRFFFVVRTSQTVDNGRGHSNQRDTVIH